MKNVKFSSIGLMDILYFTTRPKNREKMMTIRIDKTSRCGI